MKKQERDIATAILGIVLIVGSDMAGAYAVGVTVIGGVMAAMGIKELIL